EHHVRRAILWTLSVTLIAAVPLHAGTFESSAIAPELGLDALTRSVAQEQVHRDLFSNPYSALTIGHMDVYNGFPYVESRTFELATDPSGNRMVLGESGRSLSAYEGAATPLGPLSEPRGMVADEQNRVYVADTGHNRIVVLQASTEYGDIELMPLYEIT